jgi:phosphohistidine phosphatase
MAKTLLRLVENIGVCRQAIRKRILLHDIMAKIACGKLSPRTARTGYKGLTQVISGIVPGVRSWTLMRIGVGEGQTVRPPFGKQNKKKGDRKDTAYAFVPDDLPIEILHDNVSLAISFYAGNGPMFQRFVAPESAQSIITKVMRTLLILRHAKSSWDDSDLADFDRPLNARGMAAAPFMGGIIARKGFSPDVIISSPAARARETAELAKKGGDLEAEILHDERIYEASPQTLRKIAAAIDDTHRSAMMVGHNPGMEGIVQLLSGKLERMPTAALAVIDLDISSWQDIDSKIGVLRKLIRPKDEMKKHKS